MSVYTPSFDVLGSDAMAFSHQNLPRFSVAVFSTKHFSFLPRIMTMDVGHISRAIATYSDLDNLRMLNPRRGFTVPPCDLRASGMRARCSLTIPTFFWMPITSLYIRTPSCFKAMRLRRDAPFFSAALRERPPGPSKWRVLEYQRGFVGGRPSTCPIVALSRLLSSMRASPSISQATSSEKTRVFDCKDD